MIKEEYVANNLFMTIEQAKDVCNLFDRLVGGNHRIAKHIVLQEPKDYVGYWETNWYRYMNYEQLVQSEVEQGFDGDESTWEKQAKEFCESEMNISIYKLPCGMYAQYVG